MMIIVRSWFNNNNQASKHGIEAIDDDHKNLWPTMSDNGEKS